MSHSLSVENPTIQFCNRKSLASFRWPDGESTTRMYLESLVTTPSNEFVRNVKTDCGLIGIGPHVLPTTINETDYDNSWVCSPFNATITYPLDELREIQSRSLRAALAGLIHVMAPLLKAAQINKVVCVNNWLLSTNLYPPWSGDGLEAITTELQQRCPEHAVLFRSLNPISNGELIQRLTQAGYLLAPSRQIYICSDLHAAARKQNSEIDRELLDRRTQYRVIRHEDLTDADDDRIRELYDQLYLQKYSVHNPQFTNHLIRLWRTTGLLKMIGLRNPEGVLDGIVGCFGIHRTVTTPLIGYDLSRPQKLGLYRLLTALVFQEARESNCVLNLSAGAARFKRHRGGEPCLEFSAVFVRHLPFARRAIWKALSGLLKNVGARVLERYEL